MEEGVMVAAGLEEGGRAAAAKAEEDWVVEDSAAAAKARASPVPVAGKVFSGQQCADSSPSTTAEPQLFTKQ